LTIIEFKHFWTESVLFVEDEYVQEYKPNDDCGRPIVVLAWLLNSQLWENVQEVLRLVKYAKDRFKLVFNDI
jgi:hypothetical protein